VLILLDPADGFLFLFNGHFSLLADLKKGGWLRRIVVRGNPGYRAKLSLGEENSEMS